MQRLLLLGCSVFLTSAMAVAEYADYLYVPPPKAARLNEQQYPIPQAHIARYLNQEYPERVLTGFMGKNEALRIEAESPGLEVAAGIDLGAASGELFGDGFFDGGYWNFLASITSIDAYAVRVQVDMNQLGTNEEVYVIDPAHYRAFGPYGNTGSTNAPRWLPTISGDTAVLLLRSPQKILPRLGVQAVSHFYVPLAAPEIKAVECPEPIACETSTIPTEVSTGVAMLIIPKSTGQVQCTGALLNNPATETLEPLMITANHCVKGNVDAESIDVIWDYRADACGNGEVPDLDTLPHSAGLELLTQDAVLDGALIKLESVAVGTYGRAWLGWDTRAVAINETAHVMHHPQGEDLRVSKAHVTAVDVTACLDFTCCPETKQQIEVHYDEGITQGGSSGSPLLLPGNNYRLSGMLSNGNVHSCSTPAANMDNYASFQRFFPKIACHLTESETCEAPSVAPECFACPAKLLYGEFSSTVAQLRLFRDRVLMTNRAGRLLAKSYYTAAPTLSAWMKKSHTARTLFHLAATPAAAIGASLE